MDNLSVCEIKLQDLIGIYVVKIKDLGYCVML